MSIYNKKIPNVNDVVYITIEGFSESGTYCRLIEYDLTDGFILNTELDKWSRDDKRLTRVSDQKKFREKQIYCATVLAINMKNINMKNINDNQNTNDNTNNGVASIDLSYKKIPLNLREKMVENFGYVMKIKQLCDEFVFFSKIPFDIIYDNTIRKINFNQSNAKELYYDILKNPEILILGLRKFEGDIYNQQCDDFFENLKSRITYTKMSIEQYFELLIYDTDAINKLKDILAYEPDADTNTKVECVSSPRYKIISEGYTINECNSNINKCFELLKTKTEKYKAIIKLQEKNDEAGIIKQQDIYIKSLNMYQT